MGPLIITVLVWAVVFCGLVGWGSIVGRFLRISEPQFTLCRRFWLGFAWTIAFLQLWSLVLPIDWKPAVIIGLGGCLLLLMRRRQLACLIAQNLDPKSGTVKLALIALLTLWCARFAIASPTIYDSGLYHFQTIRWINEYPVVPGLGNLHTRLGFNQSHFLYVAMLNFSPYSAHGHNFANGLLLVVLLAQLFSAAAKFFRKDGERNSLLLLQVLLLPVAVSQISLGSISSPSPDLPVYVLSIVVFLEFIAFLFGVKRESDHSSVVYIAVIVFVAITIKLTFVALGFSLLGCVLLAEVVHGKRLSEFKPLIFPIFLVVALFMGPWLARGFLLTGYPCFPSTFMGLDADWRVPEKMTANTARWIYSWARLPGSSPDEVLGNWRWLQPWMKQTSNNFQAMQPLFLAAFGFVFFLVSLPRTSERRWILLSCLPLSAALSFWFFTAPDPRFAGPLFWLAAIWPIAAVAHSWSRWWIHSSRTVGAVILCICTAFVVWPSTIWILQSCRPDNMRGLSNAFGPVPIIEVKQKISRSGLKVITPSVGDQTWNSTLPSAPHLNPNLSLRGVSLKEGFRIDRNGSSRLQKLE